MSVFIILCLELYIVRYDTFTNLTYTVEGDNFEVTGCKLNDTFDEAAEFLKTVPGLEKEQLCHGELNPIKDSDVENLVKKMTVNMSKGGKRFKMLNRVYSYRQ